MQHRHLNHQHLTLSAIDDVIDRGNWADWIALRQAVLTDRSTYDRVVKVCSAHLHDAYAQRYHFWNHYVQTHSTSA